MWYYPVLTMIEYYTFAARDEKLLANKKKQYNKTTKNRMKKKCTNFKSKYCCSKILFDVTFYPFLPSFISVLCLTWNEKKVLLMKNIENKTKPLYDKQLSTANVCLHCHSVSMSRVFWMIFCEKCHIQITRCFTFLQVSILVSYIWIQIYSDLHIK